MRFGMGFGELSQRFLLIAPVVLGAIVIANAGMFNFDAAELAVLALLTIILFGPGRRGLGRR